jgi:ribonuclease-3
MADKNLKANGSTREAGDFVRLQREIGYAFSDVNLLSRCLTHVSYVKGKGVEHNEMLEFLGDAVLDLGVSELLMRRFPERSEGDLSRMRADLVNGQALAGKAAGLGLGELIRLGKGEERSGGRAKESILAGAFEALLGAVFWDGGYDKARAVVERFFAPDIKGRKLGQQDYKTRLQEISQMLFRAPPVYNLVSESGPDHQKRFATEITVGGKILGRGEGRSKKQSEQEAARQALERLKEREDQAPRA